MTLKPRLSSDLEALLVKLNSLPAHWRDYSSGDSSALYRAGFEQCAAELDDVLESLTVALDEWTKQLVDEVRAGQPFMKCLVCRRKTYHHKDIEHRYCGQCHFYHDLQDDGLTYELGQDP